MTQKHKQITVRVLTICAVIFMSLSIFTISIYKRALDADLYKEALAQSNIYQEVTNIIERKITESLVTWEKDLVDDFVQQDFLENNPLARSTLSFIINTVIDKQTPQLVTSVFDKIAFTEAIQSMTEKKIESDIAWLKGEKEAREIFNYIPTPEQIKSIKGNNFTQLFDAAVKSTFKVNKLPTCTSQQEINANIARITSGEGRKITCTNDQINSLLDAKINQSGAKKVVDTLGEKANELTVNSKIDGVLTDIYNVSLALASLKQAAINIRSAIHQVIVTSYVFLFFSLALAIAAVIFQKAGKRIKRIIIITFSTGVGIILLSLMYYVIFYHYLLGAIPFDKMSVGTSVLTSSEATLLANSIHSIVQYIVRGLVSLSMKVGVWITIISALAYGLLLLWQKRHKVKKKAHDVANAAKVVKGTKKEKEM